MKKNILLLFSLFFAINSFAMEHSDNGEASGETPIEPNSPVPSSERECPTLQHLYIQYLVRNYFVTLGTLQEGGFEKAFQDLNLPEGETREQIQAEVNTGTRSYTTPTVTFTLRPRGVPIAINSSTIGS